MSRPKNIAKVLKERINNPLETTREIAEKTWIDHSTVARIDKQLPQIATKSDFILEICDLDINLTKKWLIELDRRFSDKEELKQIRANEISQIIKESSARYTLFKWEWTDKNWWIKTSAVDKLNDLLW